MTQIGQVEAFQPEDDWEQYVERQEQVFVANKIDEDQRGPKTYALLSDLLAPEKP